MPVAKIIQWACAVDLYPLTLIVNWPGEITRSHGGHRLSDTCSWDSWGSRAGIIQQKIETVTVTQLVVEKSCDSFLVEA